MLPFFAAVATDASTPKQRMFRKQLPLALPTFEPTGLEVAATGSVIEQDANITAATPAARTFENDFIVI